MKKGGTMILLIITVVFIAFTVGFLAGRNANRNAVTIQTATAPTKISEPNSVDHPAPTASKPYLVNINTAPLAVLETLPGIGQVLAQRILDYREANGPFQDVSEIANVEGIGTQKLLNILNLITVEG